MQRWIPVALLLTLAACGGGGAAPTPVPVVAAPVLNGTTDIVFIGQQVTFSATGTGPFKWGGDQPAVATIDSNTGVVTGIATGRVTIWADNAGGHTTRLLRVLPSYNGNWTGSYTLTGCQSIGDFSVIGFCGTFSQGQVLSISFQITQSRDSVTGTFALGTLQGTLNSGVVNEDGSLPLSGTVITSGNTTIVQLSNLRATSPSAGTMKGGFDQIWSSTTLTGTGRLSCDIRDVTRTSGAPVVALQRSRELYSLDQMMRAALDRF
jgi:hypothetical protein